MSILYIVVFLEHFTSIGILFVKRIQKKVLKDLTIKIILLVYLYVKHKNYIGPFAERFIKRVASVEDTKDTLKRLGTSGETYQLAG